MNEAETKAFQLLTIAKFLLARTPIVLGYAHHQKAEEVLNKMTHLLGQTKDTVKITESREWEEIRKILKIS